MKVLLIRTGRLGDVVFASSVVPLIQQEFGQDVKIDWLVKQGCQGLFAQDPRVNKVYTLKSSKNPVLFNGPKLKLIIDSYKEPYDAVFNLEHKNSLNTVMLLIKAKAKYGRPYLKADPYKAAHAVVMHQLMARDMLKLAHGEPYYPSSLHGISHTALMAKFTELKQPYVVFNMATSKTGAPGESYKNYKAWPFEHWCQLIEKVDAKQIQIVMIGVKADFEHLKLPEHLSQKVLNLVGKTNPAELISLIQHAELLVTTDTGPSHIGSAMGTKILALAGPNDPKETGPYIGAHNKDKVHILSLNLACSPCINTERHKLCPSNICMFNMTPTMVYDQMLSILQQ